MKYIEGLQIMRCVGKRSLVKRPDNSIMTIFYNFNATK